MFKPIFLISAILLLTGCDQVNQKLGLEDPAKKEATLEAEGKAVGSGCRHSGRAIEDCYSIYSWLPKASVFAGWREMDAYMRESNMETIAPQLPPPEPPANNKNKKKVVEEGSAAESSKDTEKSADKSAAKH